MYVLEIQREIRNYVITCGVAHTRLGTYAIGFHIEYDTLLGVYMEVVFLRWVVYIEIE